MEQQSKELMELYFQTKDTFERNRILKHLLCDMVSVLVSMGLSAHLRQEWDACNPNVFPLSP